MDRRHRERSHRNDPRGHMPVTWKPASTISTSPVMPRPASLRRKAALSATSATSTLRRSGARSGYTCRIFEKPLMPRGRDRLDRSRRHRIHADVLRPDVGGQVAHARLQRRLGHAHHVVVREHALAAKIRERQDAAAAAPFHQRHRAAGERDQRVGGDVERGAEAFAGGVEEGALELGGRSERGAVHQEVEPAEFLIERVRTPP